jgi:hypothetical protein
VNNNNFELLKFEYHLALKAAYTLINHQTKNASKPELPAVMFSIRQLHSDRQGRIKETGPDHQQHD